MCHGRHFIMCIIVETLRCILETNIVCQLYVGFQVYSGIFMKCKIYAFFEKYENLSVCIMYTRGRKGRKLIFIL